VADAVDSAMAQRIASALQGYLEPEFAEVDHGG
jgi:hypothetical protein